MATSFDLASNEGAVCFTGTAFWIFHVSTACPVSSQRLTSMLRRSCFFSHSYRKSGCACLAGMVPRFSVIGAKASNANVAIFSPSWKESPCR